MISLVDCVSASNVNSKKAYELFQSVNKAVNMAHTKISEMDLKLDAVSDMVTKNKEEITITKEELKKETVDLVNEELKK